MIAELDSIDLYEQPAAVAGDENVKKVLLEVAREEKTHPGEFQTLLLKVDVKQVQELKREKRKSKS